MVRVRDIIEREIRMLNKEEKLNRFTEKVNDERREKLIELLNDILADNDYNGDEESKSAIEKSVERIQTLYSIEYWEMVKDLEER